MLLFSSLLNPLRNGLLVYECVSPTTLSATCILMHNDISTAFGGLLLHRQTHPWTSGPCPLHSLATRIDVALLLTIDGGKRPKRGVCQSDTTDNDTGVKATDTTCARWTRIDGGGEGIGNAGSNIDNRIQSSLN